MYVITIIQGDEDPDSNDERYHGNDYPEDGISYQHIIITTPIHLLVYL